MHFRTLVTVIITVSLAVSHTCAADGEFGDSCDSVEECDTNAGLTCDKSSTCGCAAEMEYNTAEAKCILRRSDYMESCAVDDDCQRDKFLTCLGGNCSCDPSKYVYRPPKERFESGEEQVAVNGRTDSPDTYKRASAPFDTVTGEWVDGPDFASGEGYVTVPFKNRTVLEVVGKCVGRRGRACNPDSECIPSTVCNSGACMCANNFRRRSDGRCGGYHGHRCSAETPCADSLSCIEGMCKCPQSTNQQFNYNVHRCQGFVYAFCELDDDCVQNSICTVSSVSGKPQCACANGFSESRPTTLSNTQILGISNTERVECRRNAGTPCNYGNDLCAIGLQCRDGVCACPNASEFYDAQRQRCIGIVGSRCTKDVNGVGESDRGHPRACVQRASCEVNGVHLPAQCVCDSGYTFSRHGFCDRA